MRIKSAWSGFSFLLLISFCLALLSPLSVAAQGDEKERAQKEDEKRQELERKTLAMTDELATQALSLRLPENRSWVLANAADLLWTHDEKRARNLFWDALNSVTSPGTNSLGDDSAVKASTAKEPTAKDSSKDLAAKRSANDKAKTIDQYLATFNARQEFLRKVARRDPQLALEMLRTTRLPLPAQLVSANYGLPDERDLEQEIANEAAARDPKHALEMARESLAKGPTYRVLGLLLNLNQQSPDAASEFAGDVIDKLQTIDLATDMDAWWTATSLLRFARPPADGPAENVGWSNHLKLSDDQRRELAEIVANAVLSVSANPNSLSAITAVMPDIEQFAPGLAAKVRAKMAGTNRAPDSAQLQVNELNSLVGKSTPEELIRAAARTSGDMRHEVYQAAVMKAVMKGKADALREFIKREVDDEGQRNSLNDLLDEQQLGWAVNHGNTEEMQKLLPLIRLKEKRAEAMAEIAMLLEKKGEHDEALKLLDEAQTLVKVDLSSYRQSNALLAVMLAYSIVDPSKAFAIIEPIIDRANDNLSKLLFLDKLVKSGFVKNGEIVLQSPGMISPEFAAFKYGPGMVALAKADFNRTRAMADRFQRNELRILTRLMILEALLHNNEKAAKQ